MPDRPERTILDDIVAARRRALEETRSAVPLERVQQMAEAREERRDFAAALAPRQVSANPSGVARYRRAQARFTLPGAAAAVLSSPGDCVGICRGGAAALSVLTEERYFLGSTQDLTVVRQQVELPVLRKDFIVESYQVYESVAVGADALLLIVAALPEHDLRSLLDLCQQLRIAALVEVHTGAELDRAAAAGARIIGVNNRNLKTLEVNLETSFRLRAKMPRGCLAISESGIKTASDLGRIRDAGFDAVLVGERFMTQPDPGEALRQLLAEFAGQPA